MVSHSAMREANPNIFSMLSLREVTAVKRRHFQANAAWVHRYELKSVLAGHQGCVNTVHWSGDVLVSGSDDMTVKLWRLPGSTPQVVGPVSSLPTGHRHNIFDAHLTSTQQVVSCGADGFVCKTSLDGFHQQLFAPAGGFRTPFAFKMDFLSEGQVFLVSFGDGKVRHFDLRAEGHTVAVNSDDVGLVGLAVEPHGNSLALGGNDPFLRIYDLRALSFHQEGSIVNMITTPVVSLHSTSSMVRNHKRWGGACRFFAPSNEICISGVCWDMGGRRLLANYRGGDIELFDFRKDLDAESEVPGVMEVFDSSLPTSCVQVNSSIRSYQGRINEQTCAKEVRFICQGAAVASGGDCGHFYIWSTDSGDLLRKLPADRCVVNSVAPHAQLPLVATSGIDAEIKTWDVDKVTERFSQPAAPAAGRAPAAPVDVGAAVELQEEGHTLIRQGAWIEALGFYEAALNLLRSVGQDQEQQNCWLNCAFCHLNLEEYEAAIECSSHALDHGPSACALLRRAAAGMALGHLDAAVADLNEAQDLEPENAELPKLRSRLKKMKKRQSKESKSTRDRSP